MEKDLDMKLYIEYLNGEKIALELLYDKYKAKLEYFIFNIVKDIEKSEDIAQEVFLEIIQKQIKEEYSFKYHIFLLAKSKAFNYIRCEKRRNEINEKYLYHEHDKMEKDILETIIKQESKKEIIEAISMLEEKYRNAMYLIKIEELSYSETAEILGETIQNIKNLIHRGKKELRKNLLKKGFDEIHKVSKVLIIIICMSILVPGIIYAATQIVKLINKNNGVTFNISYVSPLDENTINNIWVGTFELAWKELAQKIGNNEKIELEKDIAISNELNQSNFSKRMLSDEDYTISVNKNEFSGYDIYASLDKNLTFLYPFDNFSNYYYKTFGNSEEFVKYFGINSGTSENTNENVEVLFYNKRKEDFAVKLKTKENDEIILYRTNDSKSFDEYYQDIEKKTYEYVGNSRFESNDELFIPYISINGRINYKQLEGAFIKNTNGMYIRTAAQDVYFNLNEKGCNLQSKSTFVTASFADNDKRYFEYEDEFIVFMKEKDAKLPYFALKVDNIDILNKKIQSEETQILDRTREEQLNVSEGEYKFYEDEVNEYYYPNQKNEYVKVYYANGRVETVEDALKNKRLSLELLDEYEVDYVKKEKKN